MSEEPRTEKTKPVWRGAGPHSVKGVAYEKGEDAIRAAYTEARAAVASLMPRREELTEKVTFLRGKTEYTLNYEVCGGLSDIEKLVLAHGGLPPFGGVVHGIRVTVYND
ncbi:hypothetical protein HYP71_gp050 [Arthrobacter phage KBurrousTX]|uniref:Uncharacterized protein n=1 Tax=Arthrobacter phage KBurrousTX TaxID=2315608 RepID=A0A386KB36_9CAUD|nr:hypothetical protein HYP71_gp050 [Arthrobacter phage KBurrousTX]AYD81544.1 hypothetical protein KBurrousTX_50 [Arthrobacter phage KBurrousTX]